MSKKSTSPIKWVGGKTRLLHELQSRLPPIVETYFEPFCGGAALFFSSNFTNSHLNDFNSELINFYEVLSSSCEALIDLVLGWSIDEKFYYELRGWDRSSDYVDRTDLERAARFLYLNRTCFNGLWRMNAKHGYNNTPWGRPKKVDFQLEKLRAASIKLGTASLSSVDFEVAVKGAEEGDFVYFDPPYIPISKTSSFTGYTVDGFGDADQVRLRDCCDRLNEKNIKWMLSNSSSPRVFELYSGYTVEIVSIKRLIGGKGSVRSSINEVIVRNYA